MSVTGRLTGIGSALSGIVAAIFMPVKRVKNWLMLASHGQRSQALVLVDAVLSLEELLLLSDAGTVDLGLSIHASLNTCLIAFRSR